MYQLNNSVAVWRDLSLIYTILTATDHADSLAASSRLSGLQQKTPDDRTWYDSVVARWADCELQRSVMTWVDSAVVSECRIWQMTVPVQFFQNLFLSCHAGQPEGLGECYGAVVGISGAWHHIWYVGWHQAESTRQVQVSKLYIVQVSMSYRCTSYTCMTWVSYLQVSVILTGETGECVVQVNVIQVNVSYRWACRTGECHTYRWAWWVCSTGEHVIQMSVSYRWAYRTGECHTGECVVQVSMLYHTGE